MLIHFTKMHGLGNDFVLIDSISQHIKLNDALLKRIADRHLGIGCDQILYLEPPKSPDADFYFRFFNANGTEAEQCGNGIRCLARYAVDAKLIFKQKIIADCLAGRLTIQVCKDDQIAVNLGKPQPMPPEQRTFSIDQKTYTAYCLSLGNPHAVLRFETLETIDLNHLSQQISIHPVFPKPINMSFMQISDPSHITLRVYERGVGKTWACGSAAVAAVAVGIAEHKLAKTVRVHFEKGSVEISQQNDQSFLLTGSATRVFVGHFRL